MVRIHVIACAVLVLPCLVAGSAQAQTPYGSACAGSSGQPPTLALVGTPLAGQPFGVVVAGPPNALGLLVVGVSNTSFAGLGLPLALDGPPLFLELPGCQLNASADLVLAFFTSPVGSASFPATIKTGGLSIYVQTFVADFLPGTLGGLSRGLRIDTIAAPNPDGLASS